MSHSAADKAGVSPAGMGVQTATLLPEGKLARLEAAAGTRVTCLTGRLWVTLAGDGNDHLLGAG
jgi:hypothetical protein